MAERLAHLPATTLGGLRAKASALLGCAPVDGNGDYIWRAHHHLLGWWLARDLVGDHVAAGRRSWTARADVTGAGQWERCR
jgi:hypothetical protein